MSFLSVAGYGVVPVAFDSASRLPPERLGFFGRAYGGLARVAYRAEKRGWRFRTDWLLDANATSLETLLKFGAILAWSGDFIGAAPVNCMATVGEGPILNAEYGDGKGFARSLNITIVES
jgi:hypothetical protein